MEFRFLKSKSLKYTANSLVLLFLLAGSLICFIGQSKQHTGWLAQEGAPATQDSTKQSQLSSFYARIKNENAIFRGNDLFVVTSPQIQTHQKIVSQDWDTQYGKGKVLVTLEGPIASDEPLVVTYGLSVRWSKILPFLLSMLIVTLGITFCFKIHSRPELIKDRTVLFAARMICLLAVGSLVYWNLSNFGWLYGDEYFILSSTVQGNFLHSTVWPDTGRFWPLGLVDLNLLIPFGDSPFVYNLERMVIFVLAVAVIYLGIKRTAGTVIACILVTVLLLSPHMFRIYSVSIYAESRLILLLALFFLLYYRGDETKNGWTIFFSCVIASLATYFKEPVFGLFVVFALTQLLFGYARLSRAQRWANLFLLCNGAVFLSVYWWFCADGSNYADLLNNGSNSTLGLLASYLLKPFLAFAACSGLWRAFAIVFRGERRFLKYDGALFAGLAYATSFALLKLHGDYYVLPAYVCCLFAFSGYLAEIQQRLASKPAVTEPNQFRHTGMARWIRIADPRAQFAAFLTVIIVSGIANIPTSVDDVNTIVEERQNTRQLTALFAELNGQGFEIYTYIPQEMSTYSEGIQEYRRTVLNIFDFTTQVDPEADEVSNHLPFQLLKEAKTGDSSKMIVLHDITYSIETLNQAQDTGDRLEMVGNLPHVMGAHIFAKPELHTKIKRIADRHDTVLY